MKPRIIAFTLFALLTLLVSALPSCTPAAAVDNYVAVIPKSLQSGKLESISISLLRGNTMAKGQVEAILLKEGQTITRTRAEIDGRGTIDLKIPEIEAGSYDLRIKGTGFEASTTVQIQKDLVLFIQTDKPIYKPGQTIFMRVLTLNSELKPASEMVTVEILDAKGIKIFRSEAVTDEYGMAELELPLSDEPNLGVWKINAGTARAKSQLDVRVEEYVLPKYEIVPQLTREWFLVDEKIKGMVKAEYSFGLPVNGELEIKASRYVGKWEQFATITKAINGNTDFEIPAARYVAGVPGAGGSGNVMLDITVREKATGYEEKTSRLLTVAQSAVVLQLIPENNAFKPGLPFSFMVISQDPGNQPLETPVQVTITYLDKEYKQLKEEKREVKTLKGKTIVETTPPDQAVAMAVESFELTPVSSRQPGQASLTLTSSYSPSGNFIHLEQTSTGIPKAGETVRFKVYSTQQSSNFYYEVISRGTVVFSDFTRRSDIAIDTTYLMSPESRLIVYQVLPNSEVAADYLPFTVTAGYPQTVTAEFDREEARPGDQVDINIRTQGEAKVGLAAVDRSVYILAENRLNLQQVFDELEKLYMMPQAELHEASIYPSIDTKGAKEIFNEAGVTVLTNTNVPEGKDYQFKGESGFWNKIFGFFNGRGAMGGEMMLEMAGQKSAPGEVPAPAVSDTSTGMAEVQRVRQFFPETWLWDSVIVGDSGRTSIKVEVPDSITTWKLQAVAISKDRGLGIAEDELKAFQPFFLTADLPYSAIRGEEFPVRVAIYNYLDKPQTVSVELDDAAWFDLLDDPQQTIEIPANDIGSAEFRITPTRIGTNGVKVSAQTSQVADALIKTIIIEPEGIARESVENLVISSGVIKTLDTSLPASIVDDSGRVYLTLTSSYLTQTIEGLEGLIQMPFGCGEQNMILLAPDIFITRYLTETGQLKPEIMAKAEKLMITGYQRELTYRRSDGSFSAFGESDAEGSLWLTAFVLKTFSQAKEIIYVDDSVLQRAAQWISAHQNSDGSFEQVGFVHHQEMIGGVEGKTALTAYTAIALLEAGETAASGRAINYLEKQVDTIDDAYTMALTSYALELAKSGQRDAAHDKLMSMAKEDENGLHWGDEASVVPVNQEGISRRPYDVVRTTEIETTAYATLSLIARGDALDSSRASQWLVSRRNAQGGYGSTQDTVVTLQALTEQATNGRADVDLTVTLKSNDTEKQIEINQQNFDVLQIAEITPGSELEVSAEGKGEIIGQLVKRYNIPQAESTGQDILTVDVDYDTTEVEVNDMVRVSAAVSFNPPEPIEAGMVVVDISVPTGFAPVTESVIKAVESEKKIKRYDIAGRKIIFYIENMLPGEMVTFEFDVRALYPVKAKGVTSQAYSYYQPEMRGETLGQAVTVR
jgi:CD109 antigen